MTPHQLAKRIKRTGERIVLDTPRRIEMITVEQWESGKIKLTDERFEPQFKEVLWHDIPFKRIWAYKGTETGTLLHPDFGEILE